MFFLLSCCCDLLARVTRPWRQLFWLALHLYISVCSIVLNRVSEPFVWCIEVVTAYRRVKELERVLSSLRHDYEEEQLRNSELQKKLDAFTRDRRRIMEALDLVTLEKKKAVETVKFLKMKVQDLENVNEQLAESEEAQRRGLANTLAALKSAAKLHSENKSFGRDCMNAASSFDHDTQVQARDLVSKTLHDDLIEDSYHGSSDEKQSLMPLGCNPKQILPNVTEVPLIAESERGVAFISSIFSAFLSTLVAMIAWEAKDPCTPLVIALFIVVGVSLLSVVRFFSRLQSHQGFIAVGLLSLNWFVLGTLAHPALPYMGKMGSAVIYFLYRWSNSKFLRVWAYFQSYSRSSVINHLTCTKLECPSSGSTLLQFHA